MGEQLRRWAARYGWWGVFILPVVIFIPGLAGFVFIRGASYSDLAISHYPIALTIQRSWIAFQQIPLWSDTILSGFPLAANPLSSLFYPPHWIALVLPLPFGLNITAALHFVFGGIGMYRLLRLEGVGKAAALIGAVAFEAMPKLTAHWGAGHLTLIYAVAWTPWLLQAEIQSYQGKLLNRFLPGIVLGAIILADVRWSLPAVLIWGAYRFCRYGRFGWRMFAERAGWSAGNILIAVGISAVLIFPLFEYSRLSTRSLMTAADVLTYSLPPERLLGLLIPDSGSLAEWVIYPGGLVFAAVFFSLRVSTARRQSIFWLCIAAISFVYALGEALPWMPWIASLPGFNMVRVPSRMIFLAGLGLSANLAWFVHTVQREPSWGIKIKKWNPMLILVACAGIVLILGAAIGISGGGFPWRFVWGGGSLVCALLWIGYGLNHPVGRRWLGVGMILLVADLCGANFLGIEYQSTTKVVNDNGAARRLQELTSGSDARIYSPSYSLPQQTAAYWGLELAEGVDPLQLIAYQRYMGAASGVEAEGYSVTIPPFSNGDPATANQTAEPDASSLGKLSVGFVAADYDIAVAGLTLTDQIGTTRIYENELVLPRAWVQSADVATGEGQLREVVVTRTPNRWMIQAAGPGLLVVSELDYPGWKFRVDKNDAEMIAVDGLLRGVMLGDGEHTIEMVFRPVSVAAGAAVTILIGLGLIGLWVKERMWSQP